MIAIIVSLVGCMFLDVLLLYCFGCRAADDAHWLSGCKRLMFSRPLSGLAKRTGCARSLDSFRPPRPTYRFFRSVVVAVVSVLAFCFYASVVVFNQIVLTNDFRQQIRPQTCSTLGILSRSVRKRSVTEWASVHVEELGASEVSTPEIWVIKSCLYINIMIVSKIYHR